MRLHCDLRTPALRVLCAVTLLLLCDPSGRVARARGPGGNWVDAQAYGYAVGNPQRGKEIAEAKCAACHGADGNSATPQFPKLAGQNAAYLYWQLWAFKRGARRSDVMSGIVAGLSDAEMADAASFYGERSIRPDTVTDKAEAARGRRIFLAGTATTPPCATCHAATGWRGRPMMGMMGSRVYAPNLNGQHAAYTTQQLIRFATGERPSTVMGRIAAGLSKSDMKAVAEYLAGVP